MSIFDLFKRKFVDYNQLKQSMNAFDDLWNVNDINQIWKIKDTNNLIISLYGYLSHKCKYGEMLEKLAPCEKVIYLCQAFEAEINNGGFSQFFINSTGDYSMETVDSLIEIGAKKTADLMKRAISIFPSNIVPIDRAERISVLVTILNDDIDAILNELDNSFYGNEDNLMDLNYNYVICNKNYFS